MRKPKSAPESSYFFRTCWIEKLGATTLQNGFRRRFRRRTSFKKKKKKTSQTQLLHFVNVLGVWVNVFEHAPSPYHSCKSVYKTFLCQKDVFFSFCASTPCLCMTTFDLINFSAFIIYSNIQTYFNDTTKFQISSCLSHLKFGEVSLQYVTHSGIRSISIIISI